jgi:hypothetical protein
MVDNLYNEQVQALDEHIRKQPFISEEIGQSRTADAYQKGIGYLTIVKSSKKLFYYQWDNLQVCASRKAGSITVHIVSTVARQSAQFLLWTFCQ